MDTLEQIHTSTPSVDNLELSDLFKNPNVVDLYKTMQSAIRTAENVSSENKKLKEEMEELRQRLIVCAESTQPPAEAADTRRCDRTGSTEESESINSSESVASNDISNLGHDSERPSHYPFEVLWSRLDCHWDPDVRKDPMDTYALLMSTVLRQPDGSFLSNAQYEDILESARSLACQFYSEVPPPKDGPSLGRTLGLTAVYYKRYFPKVWDEKIEDLEREHPVVALCSWHWKADELLTKAILEIFSANKIALEPGPQSVDINKTPSEADSSTDETGETSAENTNSPPAGPTELRSQSKESTADSEQPCTLGLLFKSLLAEKTVQETNPVPTQRAIKYHSPTLFLPSTAYTPAS